MINFANWALKAKQADTGQVSMELFLDLMLHVA